MTYTHTGRRRAKARVELRDTLQAMLRTRPPRGFPAEAALDLYDAEDGDNLFALGHISADRMTKAIAEYIRHIHFASDAVVDDPLAVLVGGAERVRSTICHGYATFVLRPSGFCAFRSRMFVDAATEGAWPITYWPGEDG